MLCTNAIEREDMFSTLWHSWDIWPDNRPIHDKVVCRFTPVSLILAMVSRRFRTLCSTLRGLCIDWPAQCRATWFQSKQAHVDIIRMPFDLKDDHITCFPYFSHLHTIILCNVKNITESGWMNLGKITPKVCNWNFDYSSISDKGLEYIFRQCPVKNVSLRLTDISDNLFQKLACQGEKDGVNYMQALEEIDLAMVNLTDTGIAIMAQHASSLKKVGLEYCHFVSSISIMHLTVRCNIHEMLVTHATKEMIFALLLCGNLQKVSVCGKEIKDDHVHALLSNCTLLQHIDFSFTSITTPGLQNVAHLFSGITSIVLASCDVHDELIVALVRHCKLINSFHLGDTKVTNISLFHISHLPTVYSVQVQGCKVDFEAVIHLITRHKEMFLFDISFTLTAQMKLSVEKVNSKLKLHY